VKNIHKKCARRECAKCGRTFAYQSGLSRHEKRHTNDELEELAQQKVKEYQIVQEIIKTNEELQRSNEQLRQEKEMMEQALSQHNVQINMNCNNRHYNTFNIQFFLNEKCKNAINLDEFMQMVQIPQDIVTSCRQRNIVQTISDALVTALSQLSLYERPIQCSDRKRSTLYIKENNKWDRDMEHERMKNVIEEVNVKQFMALKEWMECHPNYMENEHLMNEYLEITRQLSTDLTQNNGYKKIINNVGQEVHIDKPSPYYLAP
jgi:hypothetical protein